MPTITIDVTAPQANRISSAFGKAWNLKDNDGNPRDATLAELRKFLIDQLAGVVYGMERKEAMEAVSPPADVGVE